MTIRDEMFTAQNDLQRQHSVLAVTSASLSTRWAFPSLFSWPALNSRVHNPWKEKAAALTGCCHVRRLPALTGCCNVRRLPLSMVNYRFHKSWFSGFAIPPNFLYKPAVFPLFSPLTLPSVPPHSRFAGKDLLQCSEGIKVPGLCGIKKREQCCDVHLRCSLYCSVLNSTPPCWFCAPSPVLGALKPCVHFCFSFRFKVGFISSVFSYSTLENKHNPQQNLIIIQCCLTHIL